MKINENSPELDKLMTVFPRRLLIGGYLFLVLLCGILLLALIYFDTIIEAISVQFPL